MEGGGYRWLLVLLGCRWTLFAVIVRHGGVVVLWCVSVCPAVVLST